jgi:hypothetical protein
LANNTIPIVGAILFLAQLCTLFAFWKTQFGTIGLPQVGPPQQDVVVVDSSADQKSDDDDDDDDDDEVTPVILQNEMTVDTDEQFCGCEAMALSHLVGPTTDESSTSSTSTSSESALVAEPPIDVPVKTLEIEDRPEEHANTVAIGGVLGQDEDVIAADSVTEEEEEESSWSTAEEEYFATQEVFGSSFAAPEAWIAETMAEETAVAPITVVHPLTIEEDATATEDQISPLSMPLLSAEKEESLMNALPPAAVATTAFESNLSCEEPVKTELISNDGSDWTPVNRRKTKPIDQADQANKNQKKKKKKKQQPRYAVDDRSGRFIVLQKLGRDGFGRKK